MTTLARNLLIAAAEGDVDTARNMAARGANLNALSEAGETATIIATRGNHLHIVQDLARRGAALEARDLRFGWTALLFAASKGFLEIATALLESRADVSASGQGGETSLMLACLFGHTAVAEVLLECHAEVDVEADDGKRSLTHACYKGFWATALCLVAHGASINAEDKGGRSPLAWASLRGHADIVRFLLERQGDIEVRDRLGWTPLLLAAHGGRLNSVQCLASKGANLDAKGNDGETALMLAALMGHDEVLRYLASHGADLDAVANDGMTAIKIAAESGRFETALCLAEHGADLPEEGLSIARDPAELQNEATTREEKKVLENPGGLTLTRRLATELLAEFEDIAGTAANPREMCKVLAERWGFAPTELGFRRLLRVLEEAGVDSMPLKRILHDADALKVDHSRDGLFDWDALGGIEDDD